MPIQPLVAVRVRRFAPRVLLAVAAGQGRTELCTGGDSPKRSRPAERARYLRACHEPKVSIAGGRAASRPALRREARGRARRPRCGGSRRAAWRPRHDPIDRAALAAQPGEAVHSSRLAHCGLLRSHRRCSASPSNSRRRHSTGVAGRLAGMRGDRGVLAVAVHADPRVELVGGATDEAGAEGGVERGGDGVGDRPGQHRQILEVGGGQGGPGDLVVVGWPVTPPWSNTSRVPAAAAWAARRTWAASWWRGWAARPPSG